MTNPSAATYGRRRNLRNLGRFLLVLAITTIIALQQQHIHTLTKAKEETSQQLLDCLNNKFYFYEIKKSKRVYTVCETHEIPI